MEKSIGGQKMKKYVLYGSGWEAEKFMYRFEARDEIDYVIDGYHKGTFHGMPIYNIDSAPDDLSDHMILIAAEVDSYYAIEEILRNRNLNSYYWTRAISGNDKRKKVIINCNCHRLVYQNYLYNSRDFNERYEIVDVPQTNAYPAEVLTSAQCGGGVFPEGILENCDVYIHQDIRAENKYSYYLSDEYIVPRLKKSCLSITVPNFVGFGEPYYITVDSKEGRNKTVAKNRNIVPWNTDFLIDKAYESFHTLRQIKEFVLNEDAYSNEKILDMYKNKIMKLKEREKGWDIKISSFMEENYKIKKLFYDIDHPTNDLMIEVCRKLGQKMELDDWNTVLLDSDLGWREQIVWPCVKKALGLQWEDSTVRNNGKHFFMRLSDGQLSIDEYIRQYIYWQHGKYVD